MSSRTDTLARLKSCGVVPVVTLQTASQAIPMARAFVAGGIDAIEITLRTPAARDGIAALIESDVDICVGVGTVMTQQDITDSQNIGADFIVTPATPASLIPALKVFDGLVLPGVATPTEALSRLQEGFDAVKFFPAGASGGAPFLKALSGPLPDITFMPTGGINLSNLESYLSLPNVASVGGSWLAPSDLVVAEDWEAIQRLAEETRQRVDEIRRN